MHDTLALQLSVHTRLPRFTHLVPLAYVSAVICFSMLFASRQRMTVPACVMPHTDAEILSTCSVCVLYALFHQKTFAQRWNDIQTVVTITQRVQIHASLNSPQRMECVTPPRGKGTPIRSEVTTDTAATQPSTHMPVNLVLTNTTLGTIRQILTAHPATHRYAKENIPHPAILITKERLVILQGILRSVTDETLFHALLYHHFRLTVMSELISDDRTLELTVENAIYILTPPRTTSVVTPHHFHLYLNPHDRLPLSRIHILVTSPPPIVLLSQSVFRVNALDPRVHGAAQCYVQWHMPQISSQHSRSQQTPLNTSNQF